LSIPTAALILAERGRAERTVELDTLIWRFPPIGRNQCATDVWRPPLDAVAATLSPDVLTAARERGKTLDLIATLISLPDELVASAVRA
jgi:hypothetical protein